MRARRSGSLVPDDWPIALRLILQAAERECPRGHAASLLDLTTLALHKLPARGLFDPAIRGEEDLFAAIEAVAIRHLSLGDARRSWRTALDAAALPFERRTDIESAALLVQTSSDSAYYYAGLAFGLVTSVSLRSG
jgi:hypothetical protein